MSYFVNTRWAKNLIKIFENPELPESRNKISFRLCQSQTNRFNPELSLPYTELRSCVQVGHVRFLSLVWRIPITLLYHKHNEHLNANMECGRVSNTTASPNAQCYNSMNTAWSSNIKYSFNFSSVKEDLTAVLHVLKTNFQFCILRSFKTPFTLSSL